MIDIQHDHKGEGFRISKTQNIEGMDFHKEMNLSPEDVCHLAFWFHFNYLYPTIGTSLDEVYEQMQAKVLPIPNSGNTVYSYFNGVAIDSNMTLDEVYLKVHGCTKAEFDRKVEEERRKYENRY